MKISANGISLIKKFEVLKLDAYRDAAGVWTIGYGSTRYHDGRLIKPGDSLANEAQASALFVNTLGQYEDAVNTYVKVPMSQNQYDALVSFTYNEGTGALHGSSILKYLNAGDPKSAAAAFLFWVEITNPVTKEKEVSADLLARRKIESELFLTAA
jgi:lysozyme